MWELEGETDRHKNNNTLKPREQNEEGDSGGDLFGPRSGSFLLQVTLNDSLVILLILIFLLLSVPH